MRFYKVKVPVLRAPNKKQFHQGEIVSEADFQPNRAELYVRQRMLVPHYMPLEAKPKPKDNYKIAIITAVWKRPEVFELFARSIHDLEKIDNLEIVTIIAGSEGDQSRKMVEAHNFKYIEIPNEPLGNKVNAPAYQAQQEGVDYVLCVGSDDLISVPLMEFYIKTMKAGHDFIGVLDFYFYDTNSKKAAYWGGYREAYRKGHACGAGRLISARLMKAWGWLPWENKHSLMLDNSMQEKLRLTKHSEYIFSLKENNLFALDIKSSTNMTPFKLWDNTEYIDKKIIFKQFKNIINEKKHRI